MSHKQRPEDALPAIAFFGAALLGFAVLACILRSPGISIGCLLTGALGGWSACRVLAPRIGRWRSSP